MDGDLLKTAPLPSVRRLPAYLRFLQTLKARGRVVVSCTHIADALGLVSTQVRKDLAVTGIVGKPKVGYHVAGPDRCHRRVPGLEEYQRRFRGGRGLPGQRAAGLRGLQGLRVERCGGLRRQSGQDRHADPRQRDLCVGEAPRFGVADARAHRQCLRSRPRPPRTRPIFWCSRVSAPFGTIPPCNSTCPPSVIVEDVKLSASLAVLSSRLAEMLRHARTRRNGKRRSRQARKRKHGFATDVCSARGNAARLPRAPGTSPRSARCSSVMRATRPG